MSNNLNLKDLLEFLENLALEPIQEDLCSLVERGAKMKKNERIELYLDWIKKHPDDIEKINVKIDNFLELLIGLTHLHRSIDT